LIIDIEGLTIKPEEEKKTDTEQEKKLARELAKMLKK
jgi:hypothetical protein